MPFDSMPQGTPWHLGPRCRGCKQPIAADDPIENVRFEFDPEGKLQEMNGEYHAACARPLLGLARAINMLGRSPF